MAPSPLDAGGAEAGPLIFLVAGEASGDNLAGRLMAALKRKTGERVRFAGVGGPAMAREGLDSLFPMAELSLMGLAEVLPHLPRLLRRLRQTVAEIERLAPDAVVTVDSPDFS
ncbi:MAG: lipid-A-disaccharide synthase, partial [Proteobacteria bacterium]|nr:lipid-A-disaccharide synthase [Pseudomonadota bacterium]